MVFGGGPHGKTGAGESEEQRQQDCTQHRHDKDGNERLLNKDGFVECQRERNLVRLGAWEGRREVASRLNAKGDTDQPFDELRQAKRHQDNGQ